jgi:ATPase subunit of ABC transporter with duplicated ATPase domains
MDGVSKTYPGGKKCFENIRLSFLPGVKIGVVGVNGAGKSTLLRIMAGLDKDFRARPGPPRACASATSRRSPSSTTALDVRDNVMEGVAAKKAKLAFNALNEARRWTTPTRVDGGDDRAAGRDRRPEPLGSRQPGRRRDGGAALPARRRQRRTLSGGERRRVALCKLLLEAPEMLLLDEPTNHLDAETIAWLQKHLIEYKGTILIVTHDRYFLDDITGWILELDRGRGVPWEGNYSSWLEQKAKRLEQEAREDKARQKTLERELEWVRQGAKARQAKSEGPHQRL